MRLPTTFTKYVLACVFALGLGSLAWTGQENQPKTKEGKSLTVTGCLQKGDEAGEYSIIGEDGKRYGLHSKSLDLSKHVGHKVTVTGTKMSEKNEEKEKIKPEGMNTPTSRSRISSISVKPASKPFRGAGRQNRFESSSTGSAQ